MKSPARFPPASFALLAGLLAVPSAWAQRPQTIFVIDLENRNWTEHDPAAPAQIYGNPAAPYINSLVQPGDPNAALVSYASHYHSVLSRPSGFIPSIHPSEPNYLWQEAGINFGVLNDDDPYGPGGQVQAIHAYLAARPEIDGENLCSLLQEAGISWKSYQEDIDLKNTAGGNGNLGGQLTSEVLPRGQWTVPLASFGGTSPSYRNPYNGSNQYGFACKHNGPLFFTATNGSTATEPNTSPANAEASHYAPLEQLAVDLAADTVARYNLITPDLYNDMHTELSGGFTYHGTHYTGDLAEVAQGDNFLSIVIPRILASAAFKRGGVIIIWTDETEGVDRDDFAHTMPEIVISPLAQGNAHEVTDDLTHSSDLATMQEIFGVAARTPSGYLNDAANPSNGSGTRDLADFFRPGVIPSSIAPAAGP